jgi:hypothetical protein
MGEIADALRANLRELAQSDARSLRELEAELSVGNASKKKGAIAGGLSGLSVTALRALCKERGIKGLSRAPREECLLALQSEDLKQVPNQVLNAKNGDSNTDADLTKRLDRLEALLVLVAKHVGIKPAALSKALKS